MKASAGILWAVLALGAGCREKGVGWDLQRMLQQPRYEPYEQASFFRDGSAMRMPPDGTIPRPGPGTERSVQLPQPPASLELLERGRERFDIYCSPCHGVDGDARTHVAEMMRLRPPPSLHDPTLRALDVAAIRRVIQTGYGLMPSYDALLTSRDEWAVALYVEALRLAGRAPLDRLPEELRARALRSLGESDGGAK